MNVLALKIDGSRIRSITLAVPDAGPGTYTIDPECNLLTDRCAHGDFTESGIDDGANEEYDLESGTVILTEVGERIKGSFEGTARHVDGGNATVKLTGGAFNVPNIGTGVPALRIAQPGSRP